MLFIDLQKSNQSIILTMIRVGVIILKMFIIEGGIGVGSVFCAQHLGVNLC